jgi:hypothetical protein
VEPGSRQTEIPVDTGCRGLYSLAAVRLVARDLLGFSSAPVPLPASGTLTVLPDVVETSVAAAAAGAGGEHRIHTTLRHRSEELFETRRYVPGDDPRKINWKLFARWNELLVRIGEEVPPPRARLVCYLYTGPGPGGAPAMAERALDAAVSAFAGICRYLSRRGVEVAYGFGGTALRGALGATSEREFLAELAGADWDEGERPAPAAFSPGGARLPVLLVAPEGAAGVEDFAGGLEGHTLVADRLEVSAPARDGGEGRQWWHRLLFRPDLPAAAGGVPAGPGGAASRGAGAPAVHSAARSEDRGGPDGRRAGGIAVVSRGGRT